MSRIFEGNVSIVANTKGEVALKRDAAGSWNATNAKELYAKALEISNKVPLTNWSTIWRTLVPQRFCCLIIAWASVKLVSKKLATPGGIQGASLAIRGSGMGPKPLGIAEVSPIAEAPCRTARPTSSMDCMLHIFTLVIFFIDRGSAT